MRSDEEQDVQDAFPKSKNDWKPKGHHMTSSLPQTPLALRVLGGAGTGKTESLTSRVATLVDGGSAPGDVLALAATPDAAAVLAQRLQRLMGRDARGITVTTPRALALDVLADDGARAFTGREARLLTSFETNVLMEDMKTSGMRPRRLKEMLRFFYRSWTELADDDPSWLIVEEETNTQALLKGCLALTGGLMEPEVSNLAVNYLRANGAALERISRAHVVVDDYQNLSRASQVLANMVARESIAIAGDAHACVETFESYPYAAGLDEFAEANAQARTEWLSVCHRARTTARAANGLLAEERVAVAEGLALGAGGTAGASDAAGTSSAASADGAAGAGGAASASDPAAAEQAGTQTLTAAADAPEGALEALSFDTPADEFLGVAERIERAIAEGASPASIYVACANRSWATNLGRALRERGIAVDAQPRAQSLNGDIRDNARCLAARVFTTLALAANPTDGVAWRSWCGFGDYLANSAAFMNLRAFASEAGLTLAEALEAAAAASAQDPALAAACNVADAASMSVAGAGTARAADLAGTNDAASNTDSGALDLADTVGALGMQKVISAYRAGQDVLRAVANLRGMPLLDGLARLASGSENATAPHAVVDLCAPVASEDDAATLYARAAERLATPSFAHDANAVKVGTLEAACGLDPHMVVLAGFVNGFVPCRDYFDATVVPLDKQKRMHAVDARRVYGVVGKAGHTLVASFFTSTDLESAEMLKLKISRIRLKGGVRTCTIAPSDFLATIMPE